MKTKELDSLAVSAFCDSLGMLVQAGITPDEGIALLREDSGKGGALDTALAAMQAETENGTGLADAIRSCGAFPDYAVRMIGTGETSGRTEEVLFRLRDYYAEQKSMQDKLKSVVLYPAVMLVLIIAVLAVMLIAVLPVFTGVYESMTGSLTASSFHYIGWAYGFCRAALVIMIVLAAVLLLGALLWNTKGGRPFVENLLSRIPVTASLLESLALCRFTSALNLYLASGIEQDYAVEESAKMTAYSPVEKKLSACLTEMAEGHGIARAAYDNHLFEPLYSRMLLAGERGGDMEGVLRRLSGLLSEHCTALTDRLVGIVDPLLSGILMVTIALSLLSVMLPLVGMMNGIG